MKIFLTLFLLCFVSCSPRMSDSYISEYQHLRTMRETAPTCQKFKGDSEYCLIVLVEARHLDYSSPQDFFSSMRYGLFLPQEPTIGHAWIILSGKIDGKPWFFEGGHTGEFGLTAPRYFDEVIRLSLESNDPNPAAYLFSSLPDGSLQEGSGGHVPTYAAAFPLTEEGFLRVHHLLENYDFSQWSLQRHQCVHFVLSCLSSVGIDLSCEKKLHIPQTFVWNGKKIRLWQDRTFSTLSLATPDELEKKLFSLVLQKKAFLVQEPVLRSFFNQSRV